MALVTFKLSSFGIASMGNLAPRVWFVPEGPAILPTNPDDYLLASKRIAAILGADTVTFTVDLYPSPWTQPLTRYRLVIEWLNPDGVPVGRDAPDWLFNVPPEGGSLSDMANVPITGGFVWTTTDPGDPPESEPGDLVFNPATGDLDRIV